jgi:hypothetical protein
MHLRPLLWIVLLSFGVVFFAAAMGERFERLRPTASYWLKHVPLCILENQGVIAPRRAHYVSALRRTIDTLYCTPEQPPHLIGNSLSHDLFVVSDMGGVIQRIGANGNLVWQRRLSIPRGLDVVGNRLLVGEGQSLRVLDSVTGADLYSYKFDHPILMAKQSGPRLYVLMNIAGIGAVRRYEVRAGDVKLIKSTSVVTQYPRGMDVNSLGVFVADTFGHRIIRLDSDSLELRDEVASYFPNSVQIIGDRLFSAEEHLNAISEYQLNPLRRIGPRFGCAANESHSDPLIMNATSPCEGTVHPAMLLSPNDAVFADDSVYIADTDKHRVVHLKNGQLVSVLSGFNNPTNLRAFARE